MVSFHCNRQMTKTPTQARCSLKIWKLWTPAQKEDKHHLSREIGFASPFIPISPIPEASVDMNNLLILSYGDLYWFLTEKMCAIPLVLGTMRRPGLQHPKVHRTNVPSWLTMSCHVVSLNAEWGSKHVLALKNLWKLPPYTTSDLSSQVQSQQFRTGMKMQNHFALNLTF